MSWRVSLLDIAINDYCEFDNPQDFDVYQYGVFNGGSMKEIANILSKIKKMYPPSVDLMYSQECLKKLLNQSGKNPGIQIFFQMSLMW